MDHNMRKNSYKIVLSRTWRTEGGNFLLGTRRGKVSCFMVDVPLSSIIAGSVLTGHVIRRRRDLTDWQRREGSDCVFFSTTPRPSTARTFSGSSGNTKNQKADPCFHSCEIFKGLPSPWQQMMLLREHTRVSMSIPWASHVLCVRL